MRDVSEHKLSNLRTEVPKLCSPDSKGSVTISHGIRGNIPVMAPLNMRREKKPTRCHWMVYCTYSMLKMFRALLCPSSGARDYTCMCVVTAYGVQCLVAGCRGSDKGQKAMRPGRGMLQDSSFLNCAHEMASLKLQWNEPEVTCSFYELDLETFNRKVWRGYISWKKRL